MAKTILIAIGSVAALALWLLRRYVSMGAKKDRLLKKIRGLKNEMEKYPVGSDDYNRLRAEWLRLNKQWADLTGRD